MEDLVITRNFRAGKQKVFDAWAKSENLQQWWGPKGFDTSVKAFELKRDGVFHYSIQAGNGQAMWGKFVYGNVNAPECIEYVSSFSDEEGNVTRAPFSTSWPLEISNTLTFSEADGITTLTLKGKPVNASPEEQETFMANVENIRHGFAGTLDQLEAFLAQQ